MLEREKCWKQQNTLLTKTSELFQNEHTEVQENWLYNPDTRGNDILANQSDEWKEFLSNSHSSLDNAEIY